MWPPLRPLVGPFDILPNRIPTDRFFTGTRALEGSSLPAEAYARVFNLNYGFEIQEEWEESVPFGSDGEGTADESNYQGQEGNGKLMRHDTRY